MTSEQQQRPRRVSRRVSTIATRAMMSAQMAVAMRTETKELLKAERRRDGVPAYYSQSLATMVSHATELAGNNASASLAALEMAGQEGTGRQQRETAIMAADALSQSAAHQALSAKLMYEALATAVGGSREASTQSMVVEPGERKEA